MFGIAKSTFAGSQESMGAESYNREEDLRDTESDADEYRRLPGTPINTHQGFHSYNVLPVHMTCPSTTASRGHGTGVYAGLSLINRQPSSSR